MKKRAFLTVITKSYLAQARTLAKSIRRFHDDPIFVLVVDGCEGYFDPSNEPFTVLQLGDVLPAGLEKMFFYYTPFELCNAARPFLHKYLMESTDADEWIYLDSDIYVLGSLEVVFEEFRGSQILLSPHQLGPATGPNRAALEKPLLANGVYNSGFLGLSRGGGSAEFLRWFSDRLPEHCFHFAYGVFVDQLWLNVAAQWFSPLGVVTHPGFNVAYWNLHERRVRSAEGGGYTSNGKPLLFFHFSLWSSTQPESITPAFWPGGAGSDCAEVREIGLAYRAELLANGDEKCRQWPYVYAAFSDGTKIVPEMRRHYYELLLAGTAPRISPFEMGAYFRRFAARRQLRRKAGRVFRRLAGA